MDFSISPFPKTFNGAVLTQLAWVVTDINAAIREFGDQTGVTNFSPPATMKLGEFEYIYKGSRSDAESLVSMAYSGDLFMELIQPVGGDSIFQEFIDENPLGGLQHIAYSLPESELDNFIADMEQKAYPVIMSVNHPVARIVFFDTRNETGLFTEIMGITEEGQKAVEAMKSNSDSSE